MHYLCWGSQCCQAACWCGAHCLWVVSSHGQLENSPKLIPVCVCVCVCVCMCVCVVVVVRERVRESWWPTDRKNTLEEEN